eukprot:CAMPEP_0182909778 /NCGR_PEP_ID=MMETSP0034_2-20130328/35941_1 /TAXON_ID=156128 /ORGANISM="Nephroselmis pyriformis, Strain CCMP717" /LENGTH=36 /DNA_ID= /DNA_START= /DNA_END= /DNA_ORIENTATION=
MTPPGLSPMTPPGTRAQGEAPYAAGAFSDGEARPGG